jgi:hypothetical protein
LPKPTNEYKTSFIWSGLKCLNPHIQKCYVFLPAGELIEKQEIKYPDHLSRVDYLEEVHVKIYNENMYSENDELFIKYVIGSEAVDSSSSQLLEVETRPLTQRRQLSVHVEEQNSPSSPPYPLHPDVEKTFERLLSQHAKQVLPSEPLSNV